MSKPKTTTEIHESIYGENGLYERVVEKINEIGIREASIMTEKSTQHLNMFRSRINNENARPKVETIIEIGRAVGIE